jgi:hypothetical protein
MRACPSANTPATALQWEFLPGMIVAGIGIGLINAPLMNITQGAVPGKEQSEISGLSRALSSLGGAFGTAIAGAVLMSTLIASYTGAIERYSGIPASQKPHVVQELRRDAQTVSNAQVSAYLKSKNAPAAVVKRLVSVNQDARNKGLRSALIAVGVIGLFGFVVSCFLPGGKRKAAAPEASAPPGTA